jgi:hypothetical protein
LFGLPLRQTTEFVASFTKLFDLDWECPTTAPFVDDRNAVRCYCLQRLGGATAPAAALSGHSNGMPRRVKDITGINAEGEDEWNARKHGGPKRRIQ